jgi:peptidyl-tRNA hydrolase, PTH1 family
MAELKLVVGLGNPGPEYAETRHNLGFKVIESLDAALGIAVKKQKFGARVGEDH